jgi:hypothetical protein
VKQKPLSPRDTATLAVYERTAEPKSPALYANHVPNLFAATLLSLVRRGLLREAVWHKKPLYASYRITDAGLVALAFVRAAK